MRTLAGSAKLQGGPAHQALRKQKAGATGSRAGPGEQQAQSLHTRTKKMNQSCKEETLTWASAPFPTHEGMESNWQAEIQRLIQATSLEKLGCLAQIPA